MLTYCVELQNVFMSINVNLVMDNLIYNDII